MGFYYFFSMAHLRQAYLLPPNNARNAPPAFLLSYSIVRPGVMNIMLTFPRKSAWRIMTGSIWPWNQGEYWSFFLGEYSQVVCSICLSFFFSFLMQKLGNLTLFIKHSKQIFIKCMFSTYLTCREYILGDVNIVLHVCVNMDAFKYIAG